MKRAALLAFLILVFFIHATPPVRAEDWIATWAASPQAAPAMTAPHFDNQTVRQIAHVSLGGNKVRIRLSNEFGTRPVLIGAASVALAGKGSDIAAKSVRPLTFGGSKSILLLPGIPAVSDSVDLIVPSLSDIAVSLYLPLANNIETFHQVGLQTGYTSTAGDFTTSSDFPAANTLTNRILLSGVLVQPDTRAKTIVAFGASITDGYGSTANANGRWPDVLARRLNEAGLPVAVVNEGISGNRILKDGFGASGLARFERDVLSAPGVSHVVVLFGTNDFGMPGTQFDPTGTLPTADEMIRGYKQLIERAHTRSIKIIGGTLTPFENARYDGYFSPEKDAIRQQINNWIRTSGAFDGVIDFERTIADPAHPIAMTRAYDSGDHLHPNDAGYQAMAGSIDLSLFQ